MKLELIDSESIINIPLFLDRVPAGFPSPAADYMEERINLNSTLIKHPDSTYMLRVEGNSMIDANINDGDVVIVDSALAAKDGDIVIASVDGEFTVKRLAIEQVLSNIPKEKNHEKQLDKNIDLTALYPDDKSYYRFSGSLTTPPCTEGVVWLVMKQPISASKEQIKKFQKALGHSNNRPTQPLHGRLIVN
ncbi:MAG: translesion error-prone DNA polymerase V autoproteolytic subunit [Providencia sp.]|jgi:DNA polymerase V|nr:translesion error-prone DNA polymerase V autoproteolytic subunit [Providencia sp.]